MSKKFSYNFEKYSPKDIIEYLNKENESAIYQTGIPGGQERGFLVKGVPILIRFPSPEEIKNPVFYEMYSLFGDVIWNTYDKIYYLPEDLYTSQRNIQLLKMHEKTFNKLKRKFAMKGHENVKSFKDLDWLLNIIAQH